VGCSLLPFAETVYTETGQLVALSFNYFVTDRFSFTINRRTERVARRSAG
jgi:putative flippase GtrA